MLKYVFLGWSSLWFIMDSLLALPNWLVTDTSMDFSTLLLRFLLIHHLILLLKGLLLNQCKLQKYFYVEKVDVFKRITDFVRFGRRYPLIVYHVLAGVALLANAYFDRPESGIFIFIFNCSG